MSKGQPAQAAVVFLPPVRNFLTIPVLKMRKYSSVEVWSFSFQKR